MVKINSSFRINVPVPAAHEKFRPSNGTQGEAFMDDWCGCCGKYWECDIAARTLMHDIDHPAYPDEWTYGENGEACCTAYTDHVPEPVDVFTKDIFEEKEDL